jgi:hypothetical protein
MSSVVYYTLKDWVNIDNLNWHGLSTNPKAIQLLELNYDKINWSLLSINENAISILEKNIDKINWCQLSKNKNAIHILEKNMDKINWDYLSSNPNAIHILEKNMDKINWIYLSCNPNAIHLLKLYPKKINYMMISTNSNAYDIIIDNIDVINKYMLCYNENKEVLLLLLTQYSSYIDDSIICANHYAFDVFNKYYKNFPNKLYWEILCTNPNAIDMITQNKHRINWEMISYNPEIFKIDYLKMKSPIGEELAKYCFHPSNIHKFNDWGYDG